MIAYSKDSLEKSRVNQTAEMWKKKGFISKASLERIHESYKNDLYTPNLFVRIALLLFTAILVSAFFGLITLFSIGGSSSDEAGIGIRLIIYGILSLATLE